MIEFDDRTDGINTIVYDICDINTSIDRPVDWNDNRTLWAQVGSHRVLLKACIFISNCLIT